MEKDNVVIVVDNSNYSSTYAESVPFKAQIIDKYEHLIHVISLDTNKEYELYYNQILEFLDIEEIARMINLNEYGK